MDRATELEPSRLLCGEPNDGILLGLNVCAFDTSPMRDDTVPFHLSEVSLQQCRAEIVPNSVFIYDLHRNRHAGQKQHAGCLERRVLDRDLDGLLGLSGRRRQYCC